MKKRIILISILTLFLISCTSTSKASINGKYPEITSDGQCVIVFPASYIQYFDGVFVDWDAYNPIVIPAGEHTISTGHRQYRLPIANRQIFLAGGEIRWEEDYIPYMVNYKVTYNFQKGKEYTLDVHRWEVTYDRQTGELNVTDGAVINLLKRNFRSDPVFEIIPKIEVVEVKRRQSLSIGNLFISPESTWLIEGGMGFGGLRLFPLGNRVGLGFTNKRTDMKLVGLGQFGFFIPFSGDPGTFGYNFGGLLEFHFPKIGIGLGGGIGGGLISSEKVYNEWGHEKIKYDLIFDPTPYFEVNLSTRKNPGKWNHILYFHYYPSLGEEWFKTIGFGYKLSAFRLGGGGGMYHTNVKAIN